MTQPDNGVNHIKNVHTTEDGQTPIDERQRTTGQESDTETRSGAESEAAGGNPLVAGAPNQGTESR